MNKLKTLFHSKVIVEVAPYWNVNLQAIERKEKEEAVEVAPYWNVNSFY